MRSGFSETGFLRAKPLTGKLVSKVCRKHDVYNIGRIVEYVKMSCKKNEALAKPRFSQPI
jgi:hypothetical protein